MQTFFCERRPLGSHFYLVGRVRLITARGATDAFSMRKSLIFGQYGTCERKWRKRRIRL